VEYKGSELEYHNGGDRGKLGMYDMSFRTPLIFTWPGHVESDFDDFSLVSSLDLVPTILDFVGIDKPDDLPGFSLLPLIEGGEIEQRDKIVGYNRHFRSADDMMGMKTDGYYVRTHNWHFMYFEEFGRTELYDMANDPFNYNNLADQFPELVEGFLEDIAVWKTDMGMD
jgi:uncharacterized sulfatase